MEAFSPMSRNLGETITQDSIRNVFKKMNKEETEALPPNIYDVINGLTFVDSVPDLGTYTPMTSKLQREKFNNVEFLRQTFIKPPNKSKFTKQSIITSNMKDTKSILYGICAFVMEVAMQTYACDNLLISKDYFPNIHIPKIHDYFILISETKCRCFIIMERIKTAGAYISLGTSLNTSYSTSKSQTQTPIFKHTVEKVKQHIKFQQLNNKFQENIKLSKIRELAIQLSNFFNKIKMMHNDAHVGNMYVNRQLSRIFIIDFGRAEMGLKDEPVLYPRMENTIPTFRDKHDKRSIDDYNNAMNIFIAANSPGGDIESINYLDSPRLGGKRRTHKAKSKPRNRKTRSR
jgi:hypothetical protein